jgi:hypothetical protein
MPESRIDTILDELGAVLTRTREQSLAPLAAERLASATDALEAFRTALTGLREGVVLTETTESDQVDRARARWESLPEQPSAAELSELIALSPTLATLHRAGLNVIAAQRFSPERIEVAARIGELLTAAPHPLAMLADHAEGFSVPAEAVDGLGKVIAELQRRGVVTGFELGGRITPAEGKPFWVVREKLRPNSQPTHWRTRSGTVAPEWVTFLRGDWLTAYAYGIAKDQFERSGASFEIYSKVRYQLPRDLGGGSSDIDVLVRTSSTMLAVECKSGSVLKTFGDKPNAAEKTAHDAARLDAVLVEMDVTLARHYELLYLPTAAQRPTAVAAAVGGSVRVDPIVPADLRRQIQRIAQGLPT